MKQVEFWGELQLVTRSALVPLMIVAVVLRSSDDQALEHAGMTLWYATSAMVIVALLVTFRYRSLRTKLGSGQEGTSPPA